MLTKILTEIEEAASLLLEGEPLAIPTETVYGLAAPVFFEEAIAKIFQIKGRPQDNPLIVHISQIDQIDRIAQEIPYAFYLLAEAFFPGPLTVILNKKKAVPESVSARLPTIGVRMPAHPMALKLIDAVGIPLAAPSANLSGKPSSTTAEHVLEDFTGKIKGVLDGGPCLYGIESTVILLEPHPTILRPGQIRKEQIEDVIKQNVHIGKVGEKPLSPGMKYRHYAPKAKVRLFHSIKELESHLASMPNQTSKILTDVTAEKLYYLFREADKESAEDILVLLNEAILANPALLNRLEKASSSVCKLGDALIDKSLQTEER